MPGDVSFLFEIKSRRDRGPYRITIRADADQQFVFAQLQRRFRREIARRETRQMIAENLAVEDDPCAEHRFVDLEQRHLRRWLIQAKRAPIPERVALRILLRNLAAGSDLRPRRIDESGRGLRHQARHWHRALESRGSLIHLALGNLPGAIERKHASEWWRGSDACSGREQERGENPESCELVTGHLSILSNNGYRRTMTQVKWPTLRPRRGIGPAHHGFPPPSVCRPDTCFAARPVDAAFPSPPAG